MVNFKAPPRGIIQRALPTNPINAIIKSIIGVFIGLIIIIILSPAVLWFAESQNSAKVFSFSKEVESNSGATGFIRILDMAKAEYPIRCYENKIEEDCIYYDYKIEELQYTTKDYCGTLKQNQQVLETKGKKCTRDNNDEEKCEQCYLINESNWNTLKRETKFQVFKIGNFKIPSPLDAKIIGAKEYNKEIDSTHREYMGYIPDNTLLLVAGNSDGITINHGGNNKYLLISTKDYNSTYAYLKSQDKLISWIARIIALISIFIGYTLIFGPISTLSNFARKIPLIGKFLDNGVGAIIFLISLSLTIVHFLILWILIIIIKNITLIIITLAIIIGLLYVYTKLKK